MLSKEGKVDHHWGFILNPVFSPVWSALSKAEFGVLDKMMYVHHFNVII